MNVIYAKNRDKNYEANPYILNKKKHPKVKQRKEKSPNIFA